MTLLTLAYISLGCAALPAILFLWNSFLFRPPPKVADTLRVPLLKVAGTLRVPLLTDDIPSVPLLEDGTPSVPLLEDGTRSVPATLAISVLVPARNEEASIAACIESVLASRDVELEVIVLDDHSEDRTAAIVREMARKDSRVRLEQAPPLPEGWCGKQHACFVLSKLARFPVLTFLDADVRLTPDALARMAGFLRQSDAALVSGFPQQETGTFLEKLVIPLINWVLLGFLPMIGMRWFRYSGFGAGCGQWFMTRRDAYDTVGGHASVKRSFHDGITLPRAYRKAGLHTDICDATELATCRMYRSARGVWMGLAKNAREGMAATGQILFWTCVLLAGQVLPLMLLAMGSAVGGVATVLSYLPRLAATWRFRQSWLGAVLHPLGVLALLGIQWYAVIRAATGRPVGWKGRPRDTVPITHQDLPQ